MKKITFLLFTFLLPIVAYGEKVKVNLVKEGTLESVLTEQVVTNITELEITGRFTAADIIYLRKAEGKVANLELLDLRGVTLVASDEPYNTTSGTANDDLYGSTLTRYYYLSDREEVETNQTAGKMGGANYHHYYYTMSLAGAFQDMLLEKVVLPEGMKKIGVNCFNGCKILETVVIPSSVEMIEWNAFLDDISLTTVNLEGVKEMGNSAFSGCTSLTSANLVSLEKSDILAFEGCTALTTVNIPKLAEVPSCAFENCTSLGVVTLSDNVKTIASRAFEGCSALEAITIPESLEIIEDKAFYQSSLKSLVLPNTLKTIGNHAFYECSGLESLTLSNSLESIGQNAFEGCSLTTIDFPASLKSIGSSAFYSTKLESVVFTKGDGGLTIGANAFSVYSLTSVTFAEGLETIEGSAFRHCQITNVELPEGLKSIGSYCFYDCSKLSSVTLPSTLHYVGTGAFGNTQWVKGQLAEDDGIIYYGSVAYSYTKNTEVDESITIKDGTRGIGEYFASGKKIKAVEFPSTIEFIGNEAFKGTNIKKLIFNEGLKEISESSFANCSQLAEIELPSTLKAIGKYAFKGCTSLSKIVIPEGVEQLGVPSYGAFDGCSGITQFTLNAKNLSKESSIGKLENIAKLIIGGEVQVLPSKFVTTSGNLRVSFVDRSSESTLFIGNKSLPYDNMTTLTLPNCKIELDDWAFGGVKIPIEIPGIVTAMGDGAFCGLGMSGSGVKGSIRLSEDITTLYDGAFAGCKDITSISLPNTITSISKSAFYNCSSLLSIELPRKLESIEDDAFDYCSSLTSIKIPASVTSIGKKAFYYCSSLESVEMPEGLQSIGEYAFQDCSSLTSISIPDGVTRIEDRTFYRCDNLSTICFGSGISEIGSEAFSQCSNLSDVYVSDMAKWCSISFAKYNDGPLYYAKHLFVGDKEVADLVIPEGAKTIGDYAFKNFKGLKSVVIPEGVTTIGVHAFSWCEGLTDVTIPSTVTSIGEKTFNGTDNIKSIKCYIKEPVEYPNLLFTSKWYVTFYVPKGSKALYEIADGWKEFENIVEMDMEATDGSVFIAKTAEGVDMTFKVISAKDRILQVGTGEKDVSAVNKDYEGTITIPAKVDGYTVKEIASHAFSNCNFTDIALPSGLIYIDTEAFYRCESLKSIRIPSSLQNMSATAFVSCTSVESIVVEDGNAYFDSREGCNAIIRKDDKALIRGCKNSFVPYGVERINFAAFQQTPLEGSFVIPEGVTYIGQSAFVSATMSSISLPSTLTYIGGLSFQNCNGIESVAIPEGVTYIGNYAFSFCDKLNRVTIPASVTEIGEKAFIGSIQLKTIVSYITEPCAISDNVFMINDLDDGNNSLINATLYVPFGTKTIYESTDGWKNFKNIVELNAIVGDVTGDGEVTKEDITEVETEILEPSEEFNPNKDVNRDGVVNVADIVEGNNIRNSRGQVR